MIEMSGNGLHPRSEVDALERLMDILGDPKRIDVARGIGDDCAVLSFPGEFDLLLTVDTVISGIHFSTQWQSPYGIGWRALAASVSDVAAMGGEPLAGLVALGIPGGWDEELVGIYQGLHDLSARLHVDIVGGDISALPSGLSISITVLGRVMRGKCVFRNGARIGDDIWVTGALGGGEAVRQMAQRGIKGPEWDRGLMEYERILPRIEEARFLAQELPLSSMIDISDGLSTDLFHICRMSRVGAALDETRIPVHGSALFVATQTGLNPLELALNGGEDFELCFTASGGSGIRVAEEFAERFGLQMTKIGRISGSDLILRDRNGHSRPLNPGGYDHLKAKERGR